MIRIGLLLLFLFGNLHASPHKVLICGVCRNVSQSLENTIKNIEELGRQFDEYAVVIYENNSSDDTAFRLEKWAASNSSVQVLSEVLSEKQLKVCRTERIARAQNKVLKIAKGKKYKKFKYLIMADLDFKHSWPIQEIVESIMTSGKWNAISANGIINGTTYYDRLAFRSIEHPLGPELLDFGYWGRDFDGSWFILPNDAWMQVYSAFGGLAIYKLDEITKCRYSGVCTKALKWYYKKIFAEIRGDNRQLLRYLNLIQSKRKEAIIQFRKNCREWQEPDDDSMAVCEHVAMHAEMAKLGYGKFYINPRMVMKY